MKIIIYYVVWATNPYKISITNATLLCKTVISMFRTVHAFALHMYIQMNLKVNLGSITAYIT